MAIVVSDTSPVRSLEFLGELGLLTSLFDGVFIPPAVRDELLQPRKRFRTIDVGQIPGAVVRAPVNSSRVTRLLQQLQQGEAEAIALAEEMGAKLLIDEMAGRAIANQAGLAITGMIGLLVEAKSKRLVPLVIPLLERLRSEMGFFLSERLIADVRLQVGE